MRHMGQTEVFRDPKTHVSCTTPPLQHATNYFKLKCSNPFVYFTFIQNKSKLEFKFILHVMINHLTWVQPQIPDTEI